MTMSSSLLLSIRLRVASPFARRRGPESGPTVAGSPILAGEEGAESDLWRVAPEGGEPE